MKLPRVFVILITVIVLLAVTAGPVPAQEAETLPLAEHGPYGVGWQLITFVDESREGEKLQTMIWYPAIIPEGEEEDWRFFGLVGAEPDTSAAPYPLIITSEGFWGATLDLAYLSGHLASHGFVVMGPSHLTGLKPTLPIERVLDGLFVLDQAALGIEGLTDVIDTDVVGAMGNDFGAYVALSMAGARIDPEYFLGWYAEHESEMNTFYKERWIDPWDDIVAYRAQYGPPLVEGEPWPSFADERFRAVMPIAPCYGDVFGDRGLAATTTPALLMAGTGDTFCPYSGAVYVYENLGTDNRYLLSFLENQNFPYMPSFEGPIKHFATAFFGYYLQGQSDYATYLTADYVGNIDKVSWGPVDIQED